MGHIKEMSGIKRIASGIAGATAPVVAIASDFRWPEFRFDTTPVEPLNLSGIGTQISENLGSFSGVLLIGALIAAVFAYAKALIEVKAGRLIVYRDWGDFIKSSAWIILIPLGFAWWTDDSMATLVHVIGFGAIIYGFYCFWCMISGAFKYNDGKGKWLSLFARFAVTMLLLLAVAKLYEEFDNYKRGKYGYKYRYFAFMRGVLLPLAIFAWVFQALIQPMVGLQYLRTRRGRGGW